MGILVAFLPPQPSLCGHGNHSSRLALPTIPLPPSPIIILRHLTISCLHRHTPCHLLCTPPHPISNQWGGRIIFTLPRMPQGNFPSHLTLLIQFQLMGGWSQGSLPSNQIQFHYRSPLPFSPGLTSTSQPKFPPSHLPPYTLHDKQHPPMFISSPNSLPLSHLHPHILPKLTHIQSLGPLFQWILFSVNMPPQCLTEQN